MTSQWLSLTPWGMLFRGHAECYQDCSVSGGQKVGDGCHVDLFSGAVDPTQPSPLDLPAYARAWAEAGTVFYVFGSILVDTTEQRGLVDGDVQNNSQRCGI